MLWRLNLTTSKAIKNIHYISLSICILILVLYSSFDLGLRGLWTTRCIIILTLFSGIFFSFFTNKHITSKIENWYFKLFSFLPILAACLLLVPFLGIVIVISFFGQLIGPVKEIFFEDKNLRIQASFVSVLAPPRTEIFEKKFIFEQKLKKPDFGANEIDSIKVSYDKDSTRVIFFGLYNYDEEQKGTPKIISLKRIDN